MEPKVSKVIQFLPWAKQYALLCCSKLPQHLDRQDLQAAGILGYVRAAARHRASGGASFQGYCSKRIRGAVLDEVRKWEWAPRSVHQAQRSIMRVTEELYENLEREPTARELAAALGVAPDKFAALWAQAQPRSMVPFDETSESPDGQELSPLADRLADPDASRPDVRVSELEDQRTLATCLSQLPKTEATVLVLYYLQDVPQRDLAQLLSVTPSRISQLHQSGLKRLRQLWLQAV